MWSCVLLFPFVTSGAVFASDKFLPLPFQSRDCTDYELGSAQDFKAVADKLLYFTWNPPLHYESCDVLYVLHIQNANTSEYLTPVKVLNDLSYVYDFAKDGHACIDVRASLYSYFGAQTPANATYAHTILDPVVELGAPKNLTIEQTQDLVTFKWTRPEGYEKCFVRIIFMTKIQRRDGPYMSDRPTCCQYSVPYWDNFYCENVIFEIKANYRGIDGKSASHQLIFGPPGGC